MTGRRLLVLMLLVLLVAAGPQGVRGAPRPIRLVIDGREAHPDVPPLLVDGRVLVPLRFVAEALDCEVGWDPATWTVEVRSRPSEPWVSPAVGMTGSIVLVPAGCRRTAELTPPRNPTLASRAPPGHAYLVLDLILVNASAAARTVRPWHLFRLEVGGREIEPDWEATSFSLEQPLEGEVPAGGILQGEVAFLVGAGTRFALLRVRGLGHEELAFQFTLD